MVEIPKPTTQDLAEWYRLQVQLNRLKLAEHNMRMRLFNGLFPDPVEGTNTYDINDGTGAVLKATHVIGRTVDEGTLQALATQLKEEHLTTVDLRALIKWKPELVTKEYRKLGKRELHVFDQCLVIKPGSPQLKIEIPKAKD